MTQTRTQIKEMPISPVLSEVSAMLANPLTVQEVTARPRLVEDVETAFTGIEPVSGVNPIENRIPAYPADGKNYELRDGAWFEIVLPNPGTPNAEQIAAQKEAQRKTILTIGLIVLAALILLLVILKNAKK